MTDIEGIGTKAFDKESYEAVADHVYASCLKRALTVLSNLKKDEEHSKIPE